MSDKTTWRMRALGVAAGVGVTALVLAGCSTTPPATEETGDTADAAVTIAEVNEFTGTNSNSDNGNLDINGKVNYLTRAGFYYVSDTYEVVPDESFGKMEVVSEDPLQVKYTLNDGLEWSDGEPITTDDLIFGWAATSGIFDDATLDPESGEPVSGTKYFAYAGSTEGVNASTITDVADDKLSLTLEYDVPFVDWNIVGLIDQPVHVVAEKAGVDQAELIDTILTSPRGDAAAPAPVNETLKAAADFWNSGFDMTSLPDDPSLYLSSGPWIIDSWEPTQSMTLKLNDKYTGDLKPQFSEMVIRFIGDAQAQVTALQNGEVDVIAPQASGDTLTALQAIDGVEVLQGDALNYDHLDLTFAGPFAEKNVREAFLKTIPRQQLVDTLIKPVNPEAEVLNSNLFIPAQKPYEDAVAANGSDAYADVDIEGAKELLAGATPTIRLMYNINNPNRVAAFEAIQASASQAGFVIEDVGREDWSAQLGSDIYDAVIFGWISPGVGNGTIPQIFASFGGSNFNKYANDTVDEIARTIPQTLDTDKIDEMTIEADTELFSDAYGLPLFQGPGLEAHTDRVEGITFMGNQTGVFWNFWEWTVTG
ncbi:MULTISPECIES: ABC transporter family substrate-binding protein [Microbacterium]|uniref:Oligopeptide-binding protein OppA n=1 Tax=Microbacterium trichothecenolyticum TaxID=69370 RepID=A0A0M2HL51_MICTR|nr:MULTISPECIES: ABC transporter family substrate-binding protein [Microbacterium]KJL45633.1 Oligopeptide-binding protein OppA precursor [Microbacterium trichothecenolyticum]MDR7190748.1 peptide/nickel transport system substrate-binding protein [Microbacterium sp. BE35]